MFIPMFVTAMIMAKQSNEKVVNPTSQPACPLLPALIRD